MEKPIKLTDDWFLNEKLSKIENLNDSTNLIIEIWVCKLFNYSIVVQVLIVLGSSL